MQRILNLKYAKKVDKHEYNSKIQYILYFYVGNINMSKKIHLIFDTVTRTKGISIFDQLQNVLDLFESLPEIIIEFIRFLIACEKNISDVLFEVRERDYKIAVSFTLIENV
jgi:hypothetical protein